MKATFEQLLDLGATFEQLLSNFLRKLEQLIVKIGATCGQPYFQQELLEYCQSDVKLLKQGCLKFQQEFQTLANFNPMEKCITIASACNRFFRAKCILPHTLACEPVQGWIGTSKAQSKVALEWLHDELCSRKKFSAGAVN